MVSKLDKLISSPYLVLAPEISLHTLQVRGAAFIGYLLQAVMRGSVCSSQEVWGWADKELCPGVMLYFCFPETEMWQHQGSQCVDQNPGAAFWGAGLVVSDGRSHTLLPVGTGLERRTSSYAETHQTLISTGGPESRNAQGKNWMQQDRMLPDRKCVGRCLLSFSIWCFHQECFGMNR